MVLACQPGRCFNLRLWLVRPARMRSQLRWNQLAPLVHPVIPCLRWSAWRSSTLAAFHQTERSLSYSGETFKYSARGWLRPQMAPSGETLKDLSAPEGAGMERYALQSMGQIASLARDIPPGTMPAASAVLQDAAPKAKGPAGIRWFSRAGQARASTASTGTSCKRGSVFCRCR
jgi:hypothetical protein